MASRGDTIENSLTGERMTFLETARDTDGELLRMDYVAPPRSRGPTEHVHMLQEERFEVVSGVLGVRVGGRERNLEEGQSAVGPPGVPHKWWNPGEEEEVRFVAELQPALNTEEFFETAWGLARDGKATDLGIPKNPLQLAVLVNAHQGEAYFTAFPGPRYRYRRRSSACSPCSRRSRGYRATRRATPSTAGRSLPWEWRASVRRRLRRRRWWVSWWQASSHCSHYWRFYDALAAVAASGVSPTSESLFTEVLSRSVLRTSRVRLSKTFSQRGFSAVRHKRLNNMPLGDAFAHVCCHTFPSRRARR